MPTLLVTGANRGIGLEFARQYAADGWRVIATCRDPGHARELKLVPGDVSIHALDIGDFDAVDGLAQHLKGEALDLLINNAGVYGPDAQSLDSLDYEGWAETFRIDCMAQIHVSRAFLEHVGQGTKKTIVGITSKMGSIDDNTGGSYYAYRTGKAALNMAFRSLAIDLSPRGFVVAVLHPGWVKTDMGGPNALITAKESVSGMRRVIAGLTSGNSGRFWGFDGTEIPW